MGMGMGMGMRRGVHRNKGEDIERVGVGVAWCGCDG